MSKVLTILLILVISSCSFAPVTNTKTARSIGDGNYEMTAGLSPAASFAMGVGVSDNFDLGLTIEQQLLPLLGIWGKYSLFNNNNDNAISLAAYGGVFFGENVVDTYGSFAGPVLSYKYGWFEVYTSIIYNIVRWEDGELDFEGDDDSFLDGISWNGDSVSYLQFTFGINLWFSDSFGLAVSGKHFMAIGSESQGFGTMPGVELIWRF